MAERLEVAEPLIGMKVGEQLVYPFSKLNTIKSNLYSYNNKTLSAAKEGGMSWTVEAAKLDGKPVTLVTRIT